MSMNRACQAAITVPLHKTCVYLRVCVFVCSHPLGACCVCPLEHGPWPCVPKDTAGVGKASGSAPSATFGTVSLTFWAGTTMGRAVRGGTGAASR